MPAAGVVSAVAGIGEVGDDAPALSECRVVRMATVLHSCCVGRKKVSREPFPEGHGLIYPPWVLCGLFRQ